MNELINQQNLCDNLNNFFQSQLQRINLPVENFKEESSTPGG